MHNLRWLLLALAAGCDGVPVSGALSGSGGELGDFRFAPNRCENGATRAFLGVDLFSPRDTRARVFEDPIWGRTVSLGPPESPTLVLGERSDCATFVEEIDFDRCGACGKNDTDDDDSTVSGYLRLDCATSGGGRLSGQIAFQGCVNPEEGP